jgi:hypothetical protein
LSALRCLQQSHDDDEPGYHGSGVRRNDLPQR